MEEIQKKSIHGFHLEEISSPEEEIKLELHKSE